MDYKKMSDDELFKAYGDKLDARRVDQSYGIQNVMGDAKLDAMRAELERRGKSIPQFRGG